MDRPGRSRRRVTRPPSLSYSVGKLRSSARCNWGWVNVTWLPNMAPTALRVEQPAISTADRARDTTTAAVRMDTPVRMTGPSAGTWMTCRVANDIACRRRADPSAWTCPMGAPAGRSHAMESLPVDQAADDGTHPVGGPDLAVG